jgi:branched-chain amino acid transport system substrate-binding protein
LSIAKGLLLFTVYSFLCISCTKNEPLLLGVCTSLTGYASEQGVQNRNSILLAVDNINQRGGINNRSIETLIIDDKGDPEKAKSAAMKMIDREPDIVIGHFLSTVTLAVQPLYQQAGIPLISTGGCTSQLSAQKDGYFRITTPLDAIFPAVSDYIYDTLNLRTLCVALDINNPGYTEDYYHLFQKGFTEKGGTILSIVSFDNQKEFDANVIGKELAQSGAEGAILIASGIETAILYQHIRQYNKEMLIFDSGLSLKSSEFIQNIGKSSETLFTWNYFDVNSKNKTFLQFIEKYKRRYNEDMMISGIFAYEAVMLLEQALTQYPNSKPLYALQNMKGYLGLDEWIEMNQWGDCIRPLYIMQIQNGEIVTYAKLDI